MERWTTKFITGHVGVQARLHQRSSDTTDLCPRCHGATETSLHVLQCPAGDDKWEEVTNQAQAQLTPVLTAPNLAAAIWTGVHAWRAHLNPSPDPRWTMQLKQAFRVQSKVGWGAAALGFLADDWEEIQADYLRSIGSRKSPRRWLAALIAKLWDVAWDMWSYRNYQVHSRPDDEVHEAVTALFGRIQWHVSQVRDTAQRWTLPSVASPLIAPGSTPSKKDVHGALTWLETMMLARELGVGGVTLIYDSSPDHSLLHRFRHGGLLAKLRRPKRPPALRSSHPISPSPPVLSIQREWEDEEDDPLAVQEFHAYDHGIGFPSL